MLFLIAFFFRLLANRGVPQGFDSFGHLYFAKELKSQQVGPFGNIVLKVVSAGKFSNPFMWHWLIGFLPLSIVRKYQKHFNPLIDAFFTVLIYVLVLNLGFEQRNALFCCGIYLLTPAWFSRLAMGPRTQSFTPRLSGEVVTNIFFCVTLLPVPLPNWLMVLLGAVCCLYVLSSSKFGVQALLFLTPLISFLSFSLLPVLSFLLGVSLLAVVSKGTFLNSLKLQIGHLRWYFLKNIKGEMPVSSRNKFDGTYLRRGKEGVFHYFTRLLLLLASRNSYTGVVIKMPVLLFVLIGYWFTSVDDNLLMIMVPVFAATIIYVLINLPPLLFLGEAERYLNHVAVFIIIAAVSIADALQWQEMLWFLLAYGFLYLIVEAAIMPWLNRNGLEMQEDHSKIVSYLKSHPPTVVLCYPYHAGGGVFRIMAETEHKTVFPFCVTDEFAKKFESQYAGKYPFIDLSKLNDMHNSLGVDILIVSNPSVENHLDSDWRPKSNWYEVSLGCELEKIYVYKS
jgi:hypothetical protein